MQVKFWIEEVAGSVPKGFVEIPTSDGIHKAEFDLKDFDESTPDKPITVVMPDVTGTTQFGKPIGEMPLKDQEDQPTQLRSTIARQEAEAASAEPIEDTVAEGTVVETAEPTAQGEEARP